MEYMVFQKSIGFWKTRRFGSCGADMPKRPRCRIIWRNPRVGADIEVGGGGNSKIWILYLTRTLAFSSQTDALAAGFRGRRVCLHRCCDFAMPAQTNFHYIHRRVRAEKKRGDVRDMNRGVAVRRADIRSVYIRAADEGPKTPRCQAENGTRTRQSL
jgi:hypothetical protein